jgi:hypothetical protein
LTLVWKVRRKMIKKMFRKHREKNEAFEQYLYNIREYVNYVNEELEEV